MAKQVPGATAGAVPAPNIAPHESGSDDTRVPALDATRAGIPAGGDSRPDFFRPVAQTTLGYRAAADERLARDFPHLHEWMVRTECEGKERETGTLIISCGDGDWKGCLSDRDTGLVLWRTGSSMADLMGALEKALRNPRSDWRRKKEYKPKK